MHLIVFLTAKILRIFSGKNNYFMLEWRCIYNAFFSFKQFRFIALNAWKGISSDSVFILEDCKNGQYCHLQVNLPSPEKVQHSPAYQSIAY